MLLKIPGQRVEPANEAKVAFFLEWRLELVAEVKVGFVWPRGEARVRYRSGMWLGVL